MCNFNSYKIKRKFVFGDVNKVLNYDIYNESKIPFWNLSTIPKIRIPLVDVCNNEGYTTVCQGFVYAGLSEKSLQFRNKY